ncbi:MAG: hypothetical protein F6K14_33700 [Symploca sp. SIO2C1]|nr:hypothetical protein [Symploca sp. SIO2C1]
MNIAILLKKLSMAGAALIALGTGGVAQATTTLTFDELPFQSVDDLNFEGVTFDFKIGGIDSPDARYNFFGPGSINFVDDPSLEGNAAGTLTLDFDLFVSELQFGVALSTLDLELIPGFTVELFDLGFNSLGVTPVDTNPLVSFSEGLFSYTGAPVKRAVVNFNETFADRFAFDNLTFTSPIAKAAQPIPEPVSGLSLILMGALGAGSALKHKLQAKD